LFAKLTKDSAAEILGTTLRAKLSPLFLDAEDDDDIITFVSNSNARQQKRRFHYHEEEMIRNALFYIGPEGSGTYFHTHSSALNVLCEGQKLWFLFPPKIHYGPILGSVPEWLIHVRPSLKVQPLQVVQKAGELLYIPTGWSHATINLKDVLGVAIELGVDLLI
jgi:hypothetical protein